MNSPEASVPEGSFAGPNVAESMVRPFLQVESVLVVETVADSEDEVDDPNVNVTSPQPILAKSKVSFLPLKSASLVASSMAAKLHDSVLACPVSEQLASKLATDLKPNPSEAANGLMLPNETAH